MWRCYSLEEIVAEKLRALLQSRVRLRERGWGASRVCRDYYDLWYVLSRSTLDATLLPELLARKCALRQVTFASVADFLAPELQAVARAEWERQLLPFVPDEPSAAKVLDELASLLAALRATMVCRRLVTGESEETIAAHAHIPSNPANPRSKEPPMTQQPTQPQLEIHGNVTGQAATGETVIQVSDVSGGQITITDK